MGIKEFISKLFESIPAEYPPLIIGPLDAREFERFSISTYHSKPIEVGSPVYGKVAAHAHAYGASRDLPDVSFRYHTVLPTSTDDRSPQLIWKTTFYFEAN